MDKAIFLAFYKGEPMEPHASEAFDNIKSALIECGIYTPLTLLGALATSRVEVGRNFLPIAEYASGLLYEYRKDLGNIYSGDGSLFKGRGYIQLTGRNNYRYYGELLGIDLIQSPDLALNPKIASKILALYFKERKVNVACDSEDWVTVRKLVNGGVNGLESFLRIVEDYKRALIINKKMDSTIKFVNFYGSDHTRVTYFTDTKTLQNDGETHDFMSGEEALEKSTSESFVFWDNVPMGVGKLQ